MQTQLPEGYRAAVWGASGGLGRAFVEALRKDPRAAAVIAVSRSASAGSDIAYDPSDDQSIQNAATAAAAGGPLDLVIVATGTLHGPAHRPEKALRQLDRAAFLHVLEINALLPALIAQATLPHMSRGRSIFAALSARVGSVSDNRLGGWHSYRASKAALNMLIKNIAIETARKNNEALIVGLHPGTVDTGLSEPFQGNVPEGKLFTPTYSATSLLEVLDGLAPSDSGLCFDFAGKRVDP